LFAIHHGGLGGLQDTMYVIYARIHGFNLYQPLKNVEPKQPLLTFEKG
jgi:hypothetical protein